MRIATWNVQDGVAADTIWRFLTRAHWSFSYNSKKDENLIGIGTTLRDNGIDIAMLQEVDGGSERSGECPQLPMIKMASRLEHEVYFSCHEVGKWAHQGNAILGRYPIAEHETYGLPKVEKEERKVGKAIVESDIGRVVVLTTHLTPHKTSGRINQLREVAAIADRYKGKTIVLGGDFNVRDYREMVEFIARVPFLKDIVPIGARTHTVLNRPFDHLLISTDLEVTGDTILEPTRLSDHYLVHAEVYKPSP